MSFPLRVSAVTIDLDGTLLDTIPDLAMAANMTLTELGFPELDPALIRTFVGKGLARLVERTSAQRLAHRPRTTSCGRASRSSTGITRP